jgi:hypothetical protein
MYIRHVSEKPKYLEQPYDQYNYNHNVENLFDFVVHGDECIDDPQQNTHDNYRN